MRTLPRPARRRILPPRATLDQRVQLAKALVKGTDGAGKILKTIFVDKIKEMV